ncbi:MAG TPA: hypothetical protein VF820_01185, partial [Patescibacteria group bacterium]
MTDTTAEMLMPTQPTATEQAAGTQQSQEAQLREFLDALEAEFTREAAMQEAARHGRTRDFTEERKRLEEKQKTATEKEAQQIRIELSAIEQKRADFNLAQHTDEAWVKNATVTLLKAEERLLAYAHMHPDNTSVQTTVTRMRENIQKGLRGLGEINDIKSRPQPVESEIASLTLSHAAMDRLTQMLIGKDVTFDQLRAEEKQVIGEKMIKLALFIRQNPSLQQFFETEQGLTEDKEVIMHAADVLEAQSREIIGQEKADKIVEDFGGKSTESWTQQEREAILEFLGDPTGKIRKTFTDENGVLDRIAYKKYRDAILKNAQTPSVLEKILHTFAKGLGTKTTLESFLKSGFESEDEHIRLQMLQERMRQEADKKLKTPEAARARGEVRDYLVGTFGDEADPMLFMEAAQKVMARVKREIAHLPPAEQTRRLLEEAGKLVALYSGPINDGDPKAYGLSALLEGEASEVVCTVRGMILHQLLEEVLPEKNWVILAQHQSVTFNENGEIKDPAHVRLVVLDLATKDKTTQRPVGYFVDPLFGNEKAMVSKIDEQEIARIADAYEAYRQNPRRGTLRIETSSGTVGFADSVLMADNMANMATFLYSEGDMEQARVFAEAALAEYESSEAQLILANIAQQDGQSNPQENLDAAKELNPALEKLQETNPEKYASYVGNIEQQRIKATPDEYVNEYSRLRGAGATKKEWKAFFDKLYGEISSFQATNGQYSTELSSDIYRLNSYLITFLREFYQGGQVTDGITESEAKKWGRQYEALVRIGDVEVAIGRGDFQTANTALEKFSWEAQYGAYKDFEGLGVALRTVERTAFDALTRDEGIFNHHQDEMKNAAKAALKADRSWYKGAPEDFEAAVNTASDLAYRYYYTDFTWSVRMAFGRRQLGLSKYGGQKGQTLTELFNP